MERWKFIPGFDDYQASDEGRIRRVGSRGTILTAHPDTNGYLCVKLRRDGRRHHYRVHRLIAATFLGETPAGLETCHSNDIKTDNRLINLRFDTHSANADDHVSAGNHYEIQKTHCPRLHRLEMPNLVKSSWEKRQYRDCLACARARAWKQLNPELAHLFADVANAKYAEIMEAA